jgi:organic radical activating enzyme
MACPYRCSYCINEYESPRKKEKIMPASHWIKALSRLTGLERRQGIVPITLQGGEPTVHPAFYEIINNLPERIKIDILTNLSFDVEKMIRLVDPARLRRDAPYASIRVSYHPSQVRFEKLLTKAHRLMDAGFSIGIYGVLHPDIKDHILETQQQAIQEGVDFRTKEFLGFANGRLYGQYKYDDACTMQTKRAVNCRTTELLIGSDGSVYRCHHDLYEQKTPFGHILDPGFEMMREPIPCHCFGHCNPCDIKVKTNRLQQFGYTSVDIRFPEPAQPRQKSCQRLTLSS